MKRGDVIEIYEDPVSRTKLEGKVTLIKKISNLPFLDIWLVRFNDGCVMQRFILKEGVKKK